MMSSAARRGPTPRPDNHIVVLFGAAGGLAPRSRVIIEKPFGTDLASARALNNTVHGIFGES